MSASLLLPWAILEEYGEILAAHCTCMAGWIVIKYLLNYVNYIFNSLGKACSHIAAPVSCIISAADLQCSSGVNSVTSNLCVWNHSSCDVIVIIESTLCFFYLWLKVKPAFQRTSVLGGKGLTRGVYVLLRIHLTHLLLLHSVTKRQGFHKKFWLCAKSWSFIIGKQNCGKKIC